MGVPQKAINPAIKSVRAITTGYAEQHAEHRYGSRKPRLWWVLASTSWVRIPITAFAIEHRNGLVLFDAGLDPAIDSDPNYISSSLGRFLAKRIFRFHVRPEDALDRQLEEADLSAADVVKVVISHLHFDHIGGIARVPQAQLLVARDEWRQLDRPNPEHDWILREHIELPHARWQPIEFTSTNDPLLRPFGGSYDIMGDESMVLLPTPGHTPGSLSLLVRSHGIPPLLFVGDLTYDLDLLMNDQVAGVGEPAELRASFVKVRALKQALPDLVVLPSHDPSAVERLHHALASQRTEPMLKELG